MTAVPFLPKNAPFTAEDIDVLNQLVQRSTPLQKSPSSQSTSVEHTKGIAPSPSGASSSPQPSPTIARLKTTHARRALDPPMSAPFASRRETSCRPPTTATSDGEYRGPLARERP